MVRALALRPSATALSAVKLEALKMPTSFRAAASEEEGDDASSSSSALRAASDTRASRLSLRARRVNRWRGSEGAPRRSQTAATSAAPHCLRESSPADSA